MKIKTFSYLFLFGLSVFGSCKKCTTCNSFDSAGNAILIDIKTCGNSADIEKAEEAAKNAGDLLGGSYSCTDD